MIASPWGKHYMATVFRCYIKIYFLKHKTYLLKEILWCQYGWVLKCITLNSTTTINTLSLINQKVLLVSHSYGNVHEGTWQKGSSTTAALDRSGVMKITTALPYRQHASDQTSLFRNGVTRVQKWSVFLQYQFIDIFSSKTISTNNISRKPCSLWSVIMLRSMGVEEDNVLGTAVEVEIPGGDTNPRGGQKSFPQQRAGFWHLNRFISVIF